MANLDGSKGQLVDRLIELGEDASPQIRAVVTTLMIRGLDASDSAQLIGLIVRSDAAAAIVDRDAATDAFVELRQRLRDLFEALADAHGEAHLVRTWRDYLIKQMQRWAQTAVDDADNRRRAERFLFLSDHPAALEGAQRRGFLVGLDAQDVRELARSRSDDGVSPETALELWSKLESWQRRVEELLSDDVVGEWERFARRS